MEQNNKNNELIDMVSKLLNEAKKKKQMKKSKGKEKMADKDYDGDGEVESSKDEYFGSKDKAIKKAMGKKEVVSKKKKKVLKEGTQISDGKFVYGGFPRVLKEEGVVNQFNDADDKPGEPSVATQPDMVELLGSWDSKPVSFDVASDEGLSSALRHMTEVEHRAAAADSSENITATERAALERIRQHKPRLHGLAKQRALKVKLPSFYGGEIQVDFGKN